MIQFLERLLILFSNYFWEVIILVWITSCGIENIIKAFQANITFCKKCESEENKKDDKFDLTK